MATSQDFVNWVCGPELDPHFLAYLLRASRDYIRSLSSGAIHQTVYMPSVQSFFVSAPSPSSQREIAGLLSRQLSAAERARAAVEARFEAASLLAQSRIRAVFAGSRAGEWPRLPLGDVGEIVSGVTLGRSTNGVRTRRVRYLRVANVKDGYLDLSSVSEIEATDAEVDRLRLRVGDLLLTEGGDADKLGRGCVWQGEIPECIHQNHVFRVRFMPEMVESEFVSRQIGSAYGKRYFLAHAKQTIGIATINRTVLAGFPLMLPGLAEQQQIERTVAEYARESARLRHAVREEMVAIDALTGAWLRRAFSGEL